MPFLGSEYYHLGEVIYQGEPFVKVISQDLWDKCCGNCYQISASLKSCGACRIMKYCGPNCQKIAWRDHKLECPFLQNCKNFRHQTWVQAVGNTILKINGRDWKSVTENLMDKEVSFDDLANYNTVAKLNPADMDSIKDDVEKYVGKENLPNEEKLLEIIGKVHYNAFVFRLQHSINAVCLALFIGGSKFDHSCVPNTTLNFNGKELIIRASKVMHKSEKITIAYGSIVTGMFDPLLNMGIKRNLVEQCNCSDCSLPFGKSPLTSIIDESKSVAVLQETEAILKLINLLGQLHYPVGIVTRDKLSQLLAKQEGVLGRTNLRRLRTLVAKALFRDGPEEEMKKELMELADVMKDVFGEYFSELIPVYHKLNTISIWQNDLQQSMFYAQKIAQLNKICFGSEVNIDVGQLENFMRAFHPFNLFVRR